MFTGIVQAIGRVESVEARNADLRLVLSTGDLSTAVAAGDSVAVNGLCLTAVAAVDPLLRVDVSRESLDRSCIGDWHPGLEVNLEPALTLATGLGGHLVSGHVDGIGEMLTTEPAARSRKLTFFVPPNLGRYIAVKGSVTIDGVSLTVNEVEDSAPGTSRAGCRFAVNIVPHTLERTIMATYRPGARVHIEVDLIARYLERLLSAPADPDGHGIDREMLARYGFNGTS